MEPTVTPIIYHNVLLCLLANSESERYQIMNYEHQLREGCIPLRLKSISDWCAIHGIHLESHFVWRKDYPLSANIWNLLTYKVWDFRRKLHSNIRE